MFLPQVFDGLVEALVALVAVLLPVVVIVDIVMVHFLDILTPALYLFPDDFLLPLVVEFLVHQKQVGLVLLVPQL